LRLGTIQRSNLPHLEPGLDGRPEIRIGKLVDRRTPCATQSHAVFDLSAAYKSIHGPRIGSPALPPDGKLTRAPHARPAARAEKPLLKVFSDAHGPVPVRSRKGNTIGLLYCAIPPSIVKFEWRSSVVRRCGRPIS